MKYHAPTKQFILPIEQVQRASWYFLNAIREIRESAGLPLTRYEKEMGLTHADMAMEGIIKGAEALGIDLGASRGHELDVSHLA